MICYYQCPFALQAMLQIGAQLAQIILTCVAFMTFHRQRKLGRLILTGIFVVLMGVLSILMMLDSRVFGQILRLSLYAVPTATAVAISLGYGIYGLFAETMDRRTIDRSSIKEALDDLPSGVCFFAGNGMPILCNRAMYRLGFAITGRDIQYISDLDACLWDYEPPTDAIHQEDVYILPDGGVWHFEKRVVTDGEGGGYAQFIALDVTDLHQSRVKLMRDAQELRRVSENLQTLSANMVTITREEEILAMKMRVHDEMGRCLVAARQILERQQLPDDLDEVIEPWKKALRSLRYNNEGVEHDMLAELRKACKVMGLSVITSGSLPADEKSGYILVCALRECSTNAVRYAQAKTLYGAFGEDEDRVWVRVTNDGMPPTAPIVEGGGLSDLRRRVERSGGSMAIDWRPVFELTVYLPKGGKAIC